MSETKAFLRSRLDPENLCMKDTMAHHDGIILLTDNANIKDDYGKLRANKLDRIFESLDRDNCDAALD